MPDRHLRSETWPEWGTGENLNTCIIMYMLPRLAFPFTNTWYSACSLARTKAPMNELARALSAQETHWHFSQIGCLHQDYDPGWKVGPRASRHPHNANTKCHFANATVRRMYNYDDPHAWRCISTLDGIVMHPAKSTIDRSMFLIARTSDIYTQDQGQIRVPSPFDVEKNRTCKVLWCLHSTRRLPNRWRFDLLHGHRGRYNRDVIVVIMMTSCIHRVGGSCFTQGGRTTTSLHLLRVLSDLDVTQLIQHISSQYT